jgi:hypothetical protein
MPPSRSPEAGDVKGKVSTSHRLARWIGLALLALVILCSGVWSSLAIWFRLPAGEPVRAVFAGMFAVLALATVGLLASGKRYVGLSAYAVAFALVLAWWTTMTPVGDRDWAPDVARSTTATIDGERLTVTNVRNFTWRSDTDFDQDWQQRSYRMSDITNVDLILSYWAGESIAHLIVSFGFADAPRLAFSIETRRQRDEAYSAIAGFFRQYELAIVAADERDVVRVRSNVRGEDVRIYRLRMPPADAQALLLEYVAEINDLARTPRFYNTLTGNCTTLVFDMVRAIHPGLRLDPRVMLSGYLPNYAYDLGALDTSVPFDQVRELARIHDRAARADADPDFSTKIREGMPVPH